MKEETDEHVSRVLESQVTQRRQRKLPVISIQGSARAVLAWSEDVWGFGKALIWDDRRQVKGVRILSFAEVARINGFSEGEIAEVVMNPEFSQKEKEFLIGASLPVVLTRALLQRAKARLSMWYLRQRPTQKKREKEDKARGGYASSGRIKARGC